MIFQKFKPLKMAKNFWSNFYKLFIEVFLSCNSKKERNNNLEGQRMLKELYLISTCQFLWFNLFIVLILHTFFMTQSFYCFNLAHFFYDSIFFNIRKSQYKHSKCVFNNFYVHNRPPLLKVIGTLTVHVTGEIQVFVRKLYSWVDIVDPQCIQ